jgi:acetoin utilization deacetylase AcuC-like enzyme
MISVIHSALYKCDIGTHVFPTGKWDGALRLLRPHLQPGQVLEPQPATRADLERVHTAAYLDDFYALHNSARIFQSELPITAEIRDAYILAAGGTMLAASRALADGAAMHLGGGFHHAMPDHAEGFCYVHDIAVAIRALQADGSLERVAIIDTDLHQGNASARIFQDDPRVFTFSIHQENNYPPKERSDLDIGLRDGVGDTEYLNHLEEAVPGVLDQHQPELVMMVAGADPYQDDLLGGLGLSLAGLRQRDRWIINACAQRGIPVVALTAGGYARQLQDTEQIHANTCLEILEWKRMRHDAPPGDG